MSSPFTSEQASALLHELPLNAPIVEVFMNGLYTWIFLLTLGVIWMGKRKNTRKVLWSTIIILFYVFATIHSSLTWEFFILPFQEHGASPDVLIALSHPSLGPKILALLVSAVIFIMADVIMIWRCWVVWGKSWLVAVLPSLAAVAGAVCAGLGLAGQISVALIQDPSASQGLAPLVRFSTPFLSLSLAVTLYTAGLIAWRIVTVQRFASKNGIERSDLWSALEIMVESSALYAASIFVFVVFLAMKSENQTYIQNIHVQIAGIAPTLLILRIFAGHARNDAEWSAPSSTLHFASHINVSVADNSNSTGHSRSGNGFTADHKFLSGPSSNSLNTVAGEQAGVDGQENLPNGIV
ncbi:hypothetical protein B0H11DRAFT_1859104 [Mycena galericulata]|nr:hypothetical protein B0H11DRAFT_1859104 [Mycena galericulata]